VGEKRKPTGSKLLGRELRIRRGHRSYAEMARLSESPPLAGRVEPLSGSHLHKIESGGRMPSVETLRTLSMLYGMTAEHMFRLIEAERLADLQPEGRTYEELLEEAKTSIRLGDYRGGFAAALAAEERAASEWERFHSVHNKAMCLWKLGMPKAAASEIQDVLDTPGIEPRDLLAAYYTLASIFRSLRQLTVAEDFARRGLDRSAAVPEERLPIALLRRGLGNILSDRAEQDPEAAERLCREAVRLYEKARETFLELDRTDHAGVTLASIGAAHRIEGNRLLALQRLREALNECRRARHQWGIAFTQKELGRCYRDTGEWPAARKALLEAESIASQQGYMDLQFQALVHLAQGCRENGEAFDPMVRRLRGLLPHLEDRFPEREWFERHMRELQAAEGGM